MPVAATATITLPEGTGDSLMWQAWNFSYTVTTSTTTTPVVLTGDTTWQAWNRNITACTTTASTNFGYDAWNAYWVIWNSAYEETAEQKARAGSTQNARRGSDRSRPPGSGKKPRPAPWNSSATS